MGETEDVDTKGMSAAESPGVKFVEPTILVHIFHEKIMDNDVYFQVIKLQDCFHLWIGKSKSFGDLSVAMTMARKPTSSSVLIGHSDSHTVLIAQRLSKSTGKQVFVSGDLNFDSLEIPLVEKRIAQEMKTHPDRF